MAENGGGKMRKQQQRVKHSSLFKNKRIVEQKSWRLKKLEFRERKEEKLLKAAKEAEKKEEQEAKDAEIDLDKPYRISMAVAGSLLNTAQSQELKAQLAGQIARFAALFCVDEIVVYDETARMTDEQLGAYWSGAWSGDLSNWSADVTACFQLARLLEYLECPQYLRRAVFPMQRALKFAGLMAPLEAQHHLKADDKVVHFREGVILEKPVKHGRGPFVDVGLEKELQLDEPSSLPVGTRITVDMRNELNWQDDRRRLRGRLCSAETARKHTGLYWGYGVRIAKTISDVLEGNYTYILGVAAKNASKRTIPLQELRISPLGTPRVLAVFSGVAGLAASVENDDKSTGTLDDIFEFVVDPLPGSGSLVVRAEEQMPIVLTRLKHLLEEE